MSFGENIIGRKNTLPALSVIKTLDFKEILKSDIHPLDHLHFHDPEIITSYLERNISDQMVFSSMRGVEYSLRPHISDRVFFSVTNYCVDLIQTVTSDHLKISPIFPFYDEVHENTSDMLVFSAVYKYGNELSANRIQKYYDETLVFAVNKPMVSEINTVTSEYMVPSPITPITSDLVEGISESITFSKG